MKKKFTQVTAFLILFSVIIAPAVAVTVIVPLKDSTVTREPDPKTIRDAIKAFKALPRKERKERIKEAKAYARDHKADKNQNNGSGTSMFWLIVFAIILPPLAVYLKEQNVGTHFWISILLTLLFWIPGVIYALIIVTSKG